MEPIIFQKVKSTPTGTGATKGKEFEQAFNDNFDKVKQLLTNILLSLPSVITSQEMKQIKVDNTTTPATVYYTLDDETVASPTWIKLIDLSFDMIKGDPLDSIALKTELDSKAKQTDVDLIETDVSKLKDDMDQAKADITDLDNLTQDHDTKLNDIFNNKLSHVVYNDGTTNLYFKYDPITKILSVSDDNGVNWLSINEISTSFENIKGNVADNQKIVDYVADQLTDYVLSTTFQSHINDSNNPHNVTKVQIGLGDVQNISPMNMPVSIDQQKQLDDIRTTRNPNKAVDLIEFTGTSQDNFTTYYITSHASSINSGTHNLTNK